MNRRLIIVAPTAPPEVCGVSDYSYHIAQQLAGSALQVQIGVERLPAMAGASLGTAAPILVEHWQQAVEQACASTENVDLLLNYTPRSYAWSGMPVKLITALRRFTSARPGNRLFVFFHETWSSSPELRLHHQLMARLIRWSMYRIGSLAEGLAVVNADQQQKIAALLGRNDVRLNGVGANILPASPEAGLHSPRQPGRWLTFGLAHTRLWALQAHLPFLQAMHARGTLQQLYAVGPSDNAYAQQEQELVSASLGPGVLVQCGALAAAEVSAQLLTAEAALVGMSADGLLKSGTFAALAAHATSVICDISPALSNPPGAAFIRPAELLADPGLLASAEGEQRRRQLHAWFWNTRSWEAIGRDLNVWLN